MLSLEIQELAGGGTLMGFSLNDHRTMGYDSEPFGGFGHEQYYEQH